MTVADYPDWGTPQAHADRISTTGVPLLTGAVNVINDQTHVIAAGGSVTLPTATVSQIGYEIALAVLGNAGSTSPGVTIDMLWTDAGTGITVGHETWSVISGSTSGGSKFYGTGPSKANHLAITITNQDLANSVTVTTVLNENSRIYQTDDWRQENFNTPPGLTVGAHNQQGLILVNFTGSIGIAGSAQRLLPLYAGEVVVYSRNVSATQAGAVFLRTIADPSVVASNLYENTIAASGKATVDTVTLPRSQCIFDIDNNGAAASTFEIMVLAACFRQ